MRGAAHRGCGLREQKVGNPADGVIAPEQHLRPIAVPRQQHDLIAGIGLAQHPRLATGLAADVDVIALDARIRQGISNVRQIGARRFVAGLGRAGRPFRRLTQVPRHALAADIHHRQIVLGRGLAVLGGTPEPFRGTLGIGLGTVALLIHDAEVVLGLGVFLLRRTAIPLQCGLVVPLDPVALVVEHTHVVLGTGIALLRQRRRAFADLLRLVVRGRLLSQRGRPARQHECQDEAANRFGSCHAQPLVNRAPARCAGMFVDALSRKLRTHKRPPRAHRPGLCPKAVP